MDADDGLEEDEHTFPWLPPDDRLWRHPSEIADGEGDGGSRRGGGETYGEVGRAAGGTRIAPRHAVITLREGDRRLWAVALVAGMVGAVLASGASAVVGQYNHNITVVRPIEQVIDPGTPYVTIAASSNANTDPIVNIAARLRPTIVELLVNANGGNANGGNANGSGVIFRSDGYILTNGHLVDGASSVVVVLSDGHHVNCRFVGSDRATDVAVMKMETSKTQPVAALGSSSELKVGQMAVAIGSPLGLAGGPSVTSGIISATDRRVDSGNGSPLLDMIQTDAAMEPGSSGGALVDANGMVIGITTAITVGNRSLQSLGFATPIEVARNVANEILTTGKVTHTWLGVQGGDVDAYTARQLGISGGAIVSTVDSDSPAAYAGVVPADVVTQIAGLPVDSMSAMEMNIRLRRPGDRITLTFIHNGALHISQVELLEQPRSDYP